MRNLFSALFKKAERGSVVINERSFSGNNVVLAAGGQIIIDGVVQTESVMFGPISIQVTGAVDTLETVSGNVTLSGECGSVRTVSGDVECSAVRGSVETTSGDVSCATVLGSIKTVSGDIRGLKP